METVVVKNARWQYLLLLLASLGFVAGGVFILAMGKSSLAGWAGIVFLARARWYLPGNSLTLARGSSSARAESWIGRWGLG